LILALVMIKCVHDDYAKIKKHSKHCAPKSRPQLPATTSRCAGHLRRQYDKLLRRVAAAGAAAPELISLRFPTQRRRGASEGVRRGAAPVADDSMDNAFDLDEARDWDERVRKGLATDKTCATRRTEVRRHFHQLRYQDGVLVQPARAATVRPART